MQAKGPEISPWPRRAARLGRFVVGALFVLAGGIKALDPMGFARQIDTYGWLPTDWTGPAALLLVGVEILLGAALLLDARPLVASVGTGGLLLLFIAVTAEAWSQGRTIDCGCFGNLVNRGPGEVILEDVIMLGLLVPTFLPAASCPELGDSLFLTLELMVPRNGFNVGTEGNRSLASKRLAHTSCDRRDLSRNADANEPHENRPGSDISSDWSPASPGLAIS